MIEALGLEGLETGTLAFFAFSFLAGMFIALRAVLGSRKETTLHRVVTGFVGAAYAVITVLAFMQIERVKSPYVGTGKIEEAVDVQSEQAQ